MTAAGTAQDLSKELLDELAALEDAGQRTDFFAHHPEMLRADLVRDLSTEVTRLIRVDVEQSKVLATTTRWIAERVDDEHCRALSARAAANAFHFSGENLKAQELYDEALERFAHLGQKRDEAITRSSALLNLAYLGDYARVVRWEEAARLVFQRLGDRLRLAILEHNFANILSRQDRWEEALEQYHRAYEEFLELGRTQDVAICLRNMAVCHINLHNFGEALAAHEKNRSYCLEQGLTRLVLEIDYNTAYLYYLKGEYTRAIQLFRAARRQCQAEGDEYHKALSELDLAEIYLELNLVEEAAGLARSAFESFQQLKLPYETAKALTNRAIALSRQGDQPTALDLLLQAREIFLLEKNQLWPAQIDFYRAVVLHRQGRTAEAIDLVKSALRTFSESEVASRAALCELLLAELLLTQGDTDRARMSCHDALEQLADLELPALGYQAYFVLGQVEEATHRPENALLAYRQSLQRLERLRSQLQGEDLRIAFLEDKHAVYESLVWLTLESHTPQRRDLVFAYIEKAKSRSLVDLLSFRAHELPARAPQHGELAERVRGLREELNWFYRQIDFQQMRGGEHSLEEVRKLRGSTRSREDDLVRALRELQSADRELSSLQPGFQVDLGTFRASLPEDATFLEYFMARGRIFACVVDHDSLAVEDVASASAARELHRLLQLQLSKLALGADHVAGVEALIEEAIEDHLVDLHRLLIGPIASRLSGSHLIIAPHGFLHYVPFHALSDGQSYLVDRCSISYAPSAGVYYLCAVKETAFEDRSLVVGVPDRRAPHILEEVEAVAEALPEARLLVGDQADEAAIQEHGERSRFLHIAAHGLFHRDNPMFSAIQLGRTRLSLFDLYNLRLNAELVVLSGCGTGLNAVLGADELVGLTRGLLYAGAQSVLVTLWDVNDASTSLFMRRFYHHLARAEGAASNRRAEALRRAMRDLRSTYESPYHWAPFILVGKPGGPP